MNIFVYFAGEEHMLGPDSSYKYLTTDQMDSLADDSIHPEVTDDEKQQKVWLLAVAITPDGQYQTEKFDINRWQHLKHLLYVCMTFK